MATSQNGYSAPVSPIRYELPGGVVPLRAGAAGALLAWVGRQFHSRVEGLIWPGCWGYAYRDIRGATQLSNHASGTALDLNAPKHPLGTDPAANFTATQIRAIRSIVTQTEGCVRWGGDYTGRKDPMHFEINASEQQCAAVLAKLTAAGGASTTGDDDMQLSDKVTLFDGSETSVNNVLAGTLTRLADPVLESREYKGSTDSLGGFVTAIDQNVIRLARAVEAQGEQITALMSAVKQLAESQQKQA